MTYQPGPTGILEPPDTPNNATQFAEMVQRNPERWYSYLGSIVQEHGATRAYADTVVEEQATMQTRLEETRKQQDQSNHEGQRLQEQLSRVHTPLSTPSTSVSKSEKLPDPEPYDFGGLVTRDLHGNRTTSCGT